MFDTNFVRLEKDGGGGGGVTSLWSCGELEAVTIRINTRYCYDVLFVL